MHHAALNYKYLYGHLLLGKTNIFINSFSDNLLITGNYPPVPALWWHHDSETWKYDWALQFLDEKNAYGRFFTFHRYTFFNKKYSFSITEAAIIRYDDFFRDGLRYVLPSGMITETEINDGGNNLFWFIDGYYQINKLIYFGELLIDDYALDKKSPHKLAFKIGGRYSNGKFNLQLEYLRINRWVGNYLYPELQMNERKVLIGYPSGPDAHQLGLEVFSDISRAITINAKLYILEYGEGTINEIWPVSGAGTNFGYTHEEFPSGNTEWEINSQINAYYRVKDYLSLQGSVQYESSEFQYTLRVRFLY